jgi:hypothetical protein
MSQGGMPRYSGGAPNAGADETGQEGRGGGAGVLPLQGVPGPHLIPAGSGVFRLSPGASARLAPIFTQLGYDVASVRVRFEVLEVGVHAYTDRNLVTVDPGHWNDAETFSQSRLLAHEVTHSAQFAKLGYWRTRFRVSWEARWFGDEAYDVTGELHGIRQLGSLDVGDPRFTLESIAVHVSRFVPR